MKAEGRNVQERRMMTQQVEFGSTGVFSSGIRVEDEGEAREAAAELEELGVGTIWIPGRTDDVFERAASLLEATNRVVIATGIVTVWSKTAEEVAEAHLRLRTDHPGRFVIGLGVSHAPVVTEYRKPLTVMREYLDALDREPAVPQGQRMIAALAPRMLELARERTAGSFTYLVTPDHTRRAREALGPDRVLAAELGVIPEADPERARRIARQHLAIYTPLPNYVNNWLRSGFTDDDVADGCSDRLVDALVAWGEPETIAARVREHLDAGADQVAFQVLAETTQAFHRDAWRRLARVLVNA
jgi:probable F420-dependent oxidoreductase